MSKWYYFDSDSQKIGPYSSDELRVSAKLGEITPETVLVTEGGQSIPAGKVRFLKFSEVPSTSDSASAVPPSSLPQQAPSSTLPSSSTPSSPPTGANPFTASMPVEKSSIPVPKPATLNPYTGPVPQSAPVSQSSPVPQASALENHRSSWRTPVGLLKIASPLLLFLVVAALGGPIFWESRQINAASKEYIAKDASVVDKPVRLSSISLEWKDKPTAFEGIRSFWAGIAGSQLENEISASGEFSAKAQLMENLYEIVGVEEALQVLGITETGEKEYLRTKSKYQELPESYKNGISESVPSKDLSDFRFCKLIALQGSDVALTGKISLTKDEKNAWQTQESIQVDPFFGDGYVKESQLQGLYQLHFPGTTELRPETQSAVKEAVQGRKDFKVVIDNVYGDWQFNETAKNGLAKVILGKPLRQESDSIEWTNKTAGSSEGKFTVKARATEKLYQQVDRRNALKKLGLPRPLDNEKVKEWGIVDIFEKEIFEGKVLDKYEFYQILLANEDEVTLAGNIKLTRTSDGDWQVEQIQTESISYDEKTAIRDSQLRGVFKIDDLDTKKSVETDIKEFVDWLEPRITQKDVFDKSCKPGTRYIGKCNFIARNCDVMIDFKEAAPPNTANGMITITPPDVKGKLVRPFSIEAVMTEDGVCRATGDIDNTNLPNLDSFGNRFKPVTSRSEVEGITSYWNVMNQNTVIKVLFDTKIQFTISRRVGFGKGSGPQDILIDLTRVNFNVKDTTNGPVDRSWLVEAIKKWQPKTKTVSPVSGRQFPVPTTEKEEGRRFRRYP